MYVTKGKMLKKYWGKVQRARWPMRNGQNSHPMKTNPFLLGLLFLICAACQSKDDECCDPLTTNYLPLAVGNYWKVDDNDYLEVTGKAQLADGEYFVLTSYQKASTDPAQLQQTIYLRIDAQQNLIRGALNDGRPWIVANFGLKVGEGLSTLDRIKVIAKNNDRITFEHDCPVCSFWPSKFEVVYLNGRGFTSRNYFLSGFGLAKPFKAARINGVVFKF